ncbi:MAG: hypothetical protein CME21_06555 [Gemmatimonadetes bacterium]|nr:hypothetical protein [Gemmatimonadota bacterium]
MAIENHEICTTYGTNHPGSATPKASTTRRPGCPLAVCFEKGYEPLNRLAFEHGCSSQGALLFLRPHDIQDRILDFEKNTKGDRLPILNNLDDRWYRTAVLTGPAYRNACVSVVFGSYFCSHGLVERPWSGSNERRGDMEPLQSLIFSLPPA